MSSKKVKNQIDEELKKDPEFKKLRKEKHSQFFNDTMNGLLEAVEINNANNES